MTGTGIPMRKQRALISMRLPWGTGILIPIYRPSRCLTAFPE